MTNLKPIFVPARGTTGFTLIELMIVVALVGVLASMGGTNYMHYVEKARVARSISELTSIALILDSFESGDGALPEDLAGIADQIVDPWGNPYQYLKISSGLPPGIAATGQHSLPSVSAPGGSSGGGGGGSIMASVRKDRFLTPINTDYDLYSVGRDGRSQPPLQNKFSRDDVIRASNGSYFGLATNF